MNTRIVLVGVLAAIVLGLAGGMAEADVFHMPAGQTSLQFVTVGDPGNAPDTRETNDASQDLGAVAYSYQIGKYDVTAAQYCQFLNAVARTDPYRLYNPNMAMVGRDHFGCGITRRGATGGYTYTVVAGRENLPANYVGWAAAARFCNWLHGGQPASGAEDASTTEQGAYPLDGVTEPAALQTKKRNTIAKYWIPTEHEWYKAAYYKGGGTSAGYWTYATRSNTKPSNVLSATGTNNANYHGADPARGLTPVGALAASPGPYGTFDQAGNVWQWTDRGAWIDEAHRALRGGSFHDDADYLAAGNRFNDELTFQYSGLGFRVAARANSPRKSMIRQSR